MSADITVYASAPRTYVVPKAVLASVFHASQQKDTADGPKQVSESSVALATRLLRDGRITADDAFQIHATPATDPALLLFGGETGAEWAAKIVAGVQKNKQADQQKELAKIDYDRKKYTYAGLSDASDPEFIRAVIRIPIGATSLDLAEVLNDKKWEPYQPNEGEHFDVTQGTHLEPELLAFTASALSSGCRGVYLHYGVPLCFLEDVPLLAAGVPEQLLENIVSPSSTTEDHCYAVVDSADTTAVMSVIKIKPGPQVFTRVGGKWQLDESMLDSLLSLNPPPIVELQGETLEDVLAQTDGMQKNEVVEKEGAVQPGPGITEKTEAQAETDYAKATGGMTPPIEPVETVPTVVTAAIKQLRHSYSSGLSVVHSARVRENLLSERFYTTDEGYASGFSLTAALESSENHVLRREYGIRTTVMNSAAGLLKDLRRKEAELLNVVIPAMDGALTAGVEESVKGHAKGAEQLREYWLSGKGSIRIAWGTSGDFTRCRTLLSKHLGERAAGYCAKRHFEKNGYYPGDKRNL